MIAEFQSLFENRKSTLPIVLLLTFQLWMLSNFFSDFVPKILRRESNSVLFFSTRTILNLDSGCFVKANPNPMEISTGKIIPQKRTAGSRIVNKNWVLKS